MQAGNLSPGSICCPHCHNTAKFLVTLVNNTVLAVASGSRRDTEDTVIYAIKAASGPYDSKSKPTAAHCAKCRKIVPLNQLQNNPYLRAILGL